MHSRASRRELVGCCVGCCVRGRAPSTLQSKDHWEMGRHGLSYDSRRQTGHRLSSLCLIGLRGKTVEKKKTIKKCDFVILKCWNQHLFGEKNFLAWSGAFCHS